MKRPHISTATKVNVAIEQAGGWIRCALCSGPLRPSDPRILEHLVPHELGGSSEAENLRWVHKECAGRKTNGSKATSAGGDIHKIAKAKRLATKHSQPNQPGTMKGRGFQGSKRFNGTINWRDDK
jgi:5-methylcytosine-specific restriction endonuclease McrA